MNKLNHIGIIPDGNGRWAQLQGLPRSEGHEAGLHKIEEIAQWCLELNIKYLSVYIFSLDNWKRPKEEVDALLKMAIGYFDRYPEFIENNIRILISGCFDNLEEDFVQKMYRIQEETKNCDGLIINLCANYSGRREIIDAIAAGARTEEEISKSLYKDLPDLDLIFRTGGKQRLSDFMLWNASYAELAFSFTLFPDLSKGEFIRVKKKFEQEQRNFGGLILNE